MIVFAGISNRAFDSIPILIALITAGIIVAGCELLAPGEEESTLRVLTDAEEHVVESDKRFGLNLFRTISSGESESVFISPLSISLALGMTLNGAEGETREQMQETLELAGLSEDEINESYRTLVDLLRGLDPEVVFEIANSIWYREEFDVEAEFLDVNESYFDAEVQALDFGSPEAVGIINGWVDDRTHGKIEDIVDQIDPMTVMYLINAIYFNGTWTYEFDSDATQDRLFTGHDGSTADVPMMEQETDLPYFETDAFQALDLPYGDSLYSMTVILPRENENLDDLVAGLDHSTWNDWMGRFRTRPVSLRLPRFELEYEIELEDVFSELGMEIAFDRGRADFTRINPQGGLYISSVKHKTFVDVNEEGTEAAAATSVEIGDVSAPQFIPMHVNRPFVFAVRERHSGIILFIGKISNAPF